MTCSCHKSGSYSNRLIVVFVVTGFPTSDNTLMHARENTRVASAQSISSESYLLIIVIESLNLGHIAENFSDQ